ncbi:MAG: DUF4260 family protein [Solirubrobacteraceae bacterium]
MTTITHTIQPRPAIGRTAVAALAVVLAVLIAVETITRSTGYWQIVAFGFAPDLALFYGAGRGLAQGQIHPRAVGLYNLVHRLGGPIALAILAGLGALSVGFLVGALTWAFHIALDRALGYGLRTSDGYQRP